jgi:hypothetical protein
VIRKAREDGVRIGDVEGNCVVEMFATALTWSFLHLGSLELRVAVEVGTCKAGELMPEV